MAFITNIGKNLEPYNGRVVASSKQKENHKVMMPMAHGAGGMDGWGGRGGRWEVEGAGQHHFSLTNVLLSSIWPGKVGYVTLVV